MKPEQFSHTENQFVHNTDDSRSVFTISLHTVKKEFIGPVFQNGDF